MPDIFNIIIIQPISWLLLWCYDLVNNYGIAIILFTLLTKIILLPLSYKGKKGMMQTGRLQPKVTQIQKMYKDDRAKQQQEMAKLYQQEGISPMSGCLWSLLPLPVLFGLYGVINNPVTNLMKLTHTQIQEVVQLPVIAAALTDPATGAPLAAGAAVNEMHLAQIIHENYMAVHALFPTVKDIDFSFLGLNLSVVPQFAFSPMIIIPILAGLSAWLATIITQKTSNQPTPAGSAGMIMKFMPLLSVYFGFILPAGLGVYWIASGLFGIVQDIFFARIINKKLAVKDAEREALEKRRKEQEEEVKREAAQRRAERIQMEQSNSGKRPQSAKHSNKQKKGKVNIEKPKAPVETDSSSDEIIDMELSDSSDTGNNQTVTLEKDSGKNHGISAEKAEDGNNA